MNIYDFSILRPPHESSQQACLDWIEAAHLQAERVQGKNEEELALFHAELKERLERVGCKPGPIEKRGHILKDPMHQEWDRMEVYTLKKSSSGENLSVRSAQFSKFADYVLEQFYKSETNPPDDLIHVSCTGYVSPSAAQKLVSKKGWGERTTVTHAYHMGCYGSHPAIRMAKGFLAEGKKRIDIVHTEICSLHSNPSLHQTDQLVSQSLFADGFIKYSVGNGGEGFRIIAIREEIIPDSLYAMSWDVAEWGFLMSLAKEVPVLIARAIRSYLERLAQMAGWNLEELIRTGYFAIHPGGPKILHHVQKLLNLSETQMKYSFQILREFGNMSSGTLPHVWSAILQDPSVSKGAKVVSLAFGPGLTIAGSLLEKQ